MITQAGVQMDSLIARKLWRVLVVNDTETGQSYMVGQADSARVTLPSFSTDLDDAHRVVDFFATKGWTFRVRHLPNKDVYEACFYQNDGRSYRFVEADTIPMAICNAALAIYSGQNVKL